MNEDIMALSIFSDGSKRFVSPVNPKKGERVTIALECLASGAATGVFLSGKINGVAFPKRMTKVSTRDGLERYEIQLPLYEDKFEYTFIITTPNKTYYRDQAGVTLFPRELSHAFCILTDYQSPEWVKRAVFYQIFPERFCNGRDEISVRDGEYTFDGYEATRVKKWLTPPAEYKDAHCLDFYGGDLWGVCEKVPYLKALGVTAVYLNPIFYAATVHKYDCLDYFHVDPHFGGDEALAALSKALHKEGMKLILDVSINHTGTANRWFNRDGEFFPKSEGAYNNGAATEREYYFFEKDNSYKAWFDVPTLPTLNYTSKLLRNRIYRDEDSVVRKWLKSPYNIDGWRFDVADTMARNNEVQVHHEVWPEIRRAIKGEKADAYLLAEDWSDCSEYLKGCEWDSQMNYYNFCIPVRAFYGEIDFRGQLPQSKHPGAKLDAQSFTSWYTLFLTKLPHQIQSVQFNLLDSHDVPRFHNDKKITFDEVQGAALLMFTLPGAPSIYYGDEAAIDGRVNSTEGCRYPMPWDDNEHGETKIKSKREYKLYHALCRLRRENEELCDGSFRAFDGGSHIFAFARFSSEHVFIIAASNSEESQSVKLPVSIFGERYSAQKVYEKDELGRPLDAKASEGTLSIKLPPLGSCIIKL